MICFCQNESIVAVFAVRQGIVRQFTRDRYFRCAEESRRANQRFDPIRVGFGEMLPEIRSLHQMAVRRVVLRQ
jgi:hypothetical protein